MLGISTNPIEKIKEFKAQYGLRSLLGTLQTHFRLFEEYAMILPTGLITLCFFPLVRAHVQLHHAFRSRVRCGGGVWRSLETPLRGHFCEPVLSPPSPAAHPLSHTSVLESVRVRFACIVVCAFACACVIEE